MIRRTHIHFGPGNLGIGLVLPSLSRDLRLAIVQRERSDWKDLPHEGILRLHNGVEYSATAQVLTDRSSDDYLNNRIAEWLADSPTTLFLYSDNWYQSRYHFLLDAGIDSISCSVGDGQSTILDRLSSLDFGSLPRIYAFENAVAASLFKPDNQLPVVSVVPDRICMGRENIGDEIRVSAEGKGEIVINADDEETRHLFPSVENSAVQVRFVADPRTFSYYADKKKFLMNGLHYILASLSYLFLAAARIPSKDWTKQYLSILQRVLLQRGSIFEPHIENYTDAQILRLIYLYKDEIRQVDETVRNLEDMFDVLRDYSAEVRMRLSRPDSLARVLDHTDQDKVRVKFQRYLAEIGEFFAVHGRELDRFAIRNRPFAEDVRASIGFLSRPNVPPP